MPQGELKRILYVDDEPDLREVAGLALESVGGFEVSLCESGMQAPDRIRREKPDLVLLDVMMPEMDGPAVLKALRADPETAGIPVIFFTAKAQPSEIEALRALGAVDVLNKPFDPMTLADEIRTVWSRGDG